MSEDVRDVALRGFVAYNEGDLDTLLGLVHDEMVAVVPVDYPNAGVYEGRAGFRHMVEQWNDVWDQVRADPGEPIVEGNAAVVPVHQVARGRGSGAEVEIRLAYLLRVRDGLLVEWRLCASVEEALELVRAG